ncbi:MAG TPA: twin-arginine translocase subunit TatB [Chloroflexi bacterium]|nr:twin-arginine translocase subunit TatB [Chloroflexota bacterium]
MDSFFGIGIFELFLIAVIALVVMGPERLPGAMRTIAGYMRQIRNISNEFTSQFSEEIKLLEELDPRRMVNEVLDPTKTPAPANKTPLAQSTPARPNTTSNVAKSTAAAAAVAKTSPKATEATDNSILPPPDATAVHNASQPPVVTSEVNTAASSAAEADVAAAPTVDGATSSAEAAR